MQIESVKKMELLLPEWIIQYNCKKAMRRGQGDAEETIKVGRERRMIRSERVSAEGARRNRSA